MKTKKLFTITLSIVMICVLALSLCACLKIGLQRDKVITRLQEAGATVEYVRSTPMTAVGQNSHNIGDMLRATAQINDQDEVVYIIYANDQDSFEWVKECCETYKADQIEQNPEPAEGETDYNSWIVYTYDYMVMIGHFRMVAMARSY